MIGSKKSSNNMTTEEYRNANSKLTACDAISDSSVVEGSVATTQKKIKIDLTLLSS